MSPAKVASPPQTNGPANWDTDGDTMDDGWEYTNYAYSAGTDPLTIDILGDPDGERGELIASGENLKYDGVLYADQLIQYFTSS